MVTSLNSCSAASHLPLIDPEEKKTMIKIKRLQLHCLHILLLTIFSSVPFAHAQTDGLSLEDIVSLKRVTSIRMSPDSEQIAYLLSVPREIQGHLFCRQAKSG
jgi:hypothetical protein